jgi:hypothetical protein
LHALVTIPNDFSSAAIIAFLLMSLFVICILSFLAIANKFDVKFTLD